MKRIIIVTDLTRFTNPNIVCIAGVDTNTAECIRPMPYIASSVCRQLPILPGALLSGDFSPLPILSGPHQEDQSYENLTLLGSCTSEQFRTALLKSCFRSVEDGFEVALPTGQKVISLDHSGHRSIITIAVLPSEIEIVEDGYKPGKIKIHFRDASGRAFRFLGITDLGFHDYALQHQKSNELVALNGLIQAQEEVFLRVGLTRSYTAQDGRSGYWLQANGIYTFPHYNKDLRSYTP